MDTKTLATVIAIFLCVLLIPAAIGIVGGIIGVFGSLIGAIFSVIGGIFSAIFSFTGAILGWLFYDNFSWYWPFEFFNWELFTVVALVVLVIVISRSNPSRSRR